MNIKNSIKFQKLKQTLSWENIIVMIILVPSMFILTHWSFKDQPLPDYVKEIIITLIQFVICPIVASKGAGNYIFGNLNISKRNNQEIK